MKKALIVTTVASMIDQFLIPNIQTLTELGYEIHTACNFENGSSCSDERVQELKSRLSALGVVCHQIDFARKITKISENARAYKQIKRVILDNEFDLLHCHSPIGSVLARLACRKARKRGTKVLYTAHGFHFFKGAPLKNWLLYYSAEKLCSRYTDLLITINQEDYALAKRKMKAKRVEYVPGVGIDLSRFENVEIDRVEKRREIGVPEDAFLLLSVGELNENKNHEVVLRAVAKLNDPHVHYAIAGIGNKKDYLLDLAKELGVDQQLHLLGYRRDIPELNSVSDAFCFPSFREGLGLAAIEAMACGLPIVTSNVHGINDYSVDGVTGYKCAPSDVDGFADAICKLAVDPALRAEMGQGNVLIAQKYDVHPINAQMERIYQL